MQTVARVTQPETDATRVASPTNGDQCISNQSETETNCSPRFRARIQSNEPVTLSRSLLLIIFNNSISCGLMRGSKLGPHYICLPASRLADVS